MLIALFAVFAGGYMEAEFDQVPKGVMKAYKKQLAQYAGAKFVKLERQVVAGLNYRFTIEIDGKMAQLTFWYKLNYYVEFTGLAWVSY